MGYGVMSEYVAAVEALKASLWLARMLAELRGIAVPTVLLLEDNQACIRMASNPVVSSRNRHFAMRMWWLRQQVEERTVRMQHVPTDEQRADIFTKTLPAPRFLALRDVIMSKHATQTVRANANPVGIWGGVSRGKLHLYTPDHPQNCRHRLQTSFTPPGCSTFLYFCISMEHLLLNMPTRGYMPSLSIYRMFLLSNSLFRLFLLSNSVSRVSFYSFPYCPFVNTT